MLKRLFFLFAALSTSAWATAPDCERLLAESGQLILGNSRQIEGIRALADRIASSGATVLILGETGTGKELLARHIHERSTRKKRPFIMVNCSAIPSELLESELFGHVKGAFTGAVNPKKGLFDEAEGGTLFLDEIGDMPLPLQLKLLSVLQNREIRPVGSITSRPIDVRVIAATHQNLKKRIELGTFREDLFYRLNVIPLSLPPLRERKSDITIIANAKLAKVVAKNNLSIKGFTPGALIRLANHVWLGNVRELENIIERSAILARGEFVTENDLFLGDVIDPTIFADTFTASADPADADPLDLRAVLTWLPSFPVIRGEYFIRAMQKEDAAITQREERLNPSLIKHKNNFLRGKIGKRLKYKSHEILRSERFARRMRVVQGTLKPKIDEFFGEFEPALPEYDSLKRLYLRFVSQQLREDREAIQQFKIATHFKSDYKRQSSSK